MIQVIEDDLVTSHIITAILRRMRVTYREAYTGTVALEQLRTLPIDLIIMDMGLPDMHGLDLLRQKNEMPFVCDLPVVCCTAQADIETVEAAMGLGAIDFVKKPIAVHAFADRITRAMDRVPAHWESWRNMNRRGQSYVYRSETMLVIAKKVLWELNDALERVQFSTIHLHDLDTMVTRARGAAANVGALRTVRQIDHLWSGAGTLGEIDNLHSALVIELARFDEEIESHLIHNEPLANVS